MVFWKLPGFSALNCNIPFNPPKNLLSRVLLPDLRKQDFPEHQPLLRAPSEQVSEIVLISGQSLSNALGINVTTPLLSEQALALALQEWGDLQALKGQRKCALMEAGAHDVGICKGQDLPSLCHSVKYGGASPMLCFLQKPS